MKKPLILIPPTFFEDTPTGVYGLNCTYMDWVARAGGIPVMLHHENGIPVMPHHEDGLNYYADALAHADGVLFPGGPDLDPEHWNELPIPQCGRIDPVRDCTEKLLFDAAIAANLPMLGICRGMQVLNVFLGGSLYQDIGAQFGKNVGHSQGCSGDIATHEISLVEGTPLRDIAGSGTVRVNTFHHQAVRELGLGLTAMAHAEDGIIEAFCASTHPFLWGMQFHPEKMEAHNTLSRGIFAAFMAACRK